MNSINESARLNLLPFGTVHVELMLETPSEPLRVDGEPPAGRMKVFPQLTALTQLVADPAPSVVV